MKLGQSMSAKADQIFDGFLTRSAILFLRCENPTATAYEYLPCDICESYAIARLIVACGRS
jgi:hypothetical protein